MRYALMESPFGYLTLVSGDAGLERVAFGAQIPNGVVPDPKANAVARAQLIEYFAGRLQNFDLPLSLDGTPFQRLVWGALQDIPYGETRSYGEIACAIGRPRAARAVGMANHQNPISIIVPCHRVIGGSGDLVGYGGGLDIKAALLELEGASQSTPLAGRATVSQPVLLG